MVALELFLDKLALKGALVVLSAVGVVRPILGVLVLSGRELLIVEFLDILDDYLIGFVGLILFLILLDQVIEGKIHFQVI